MKGKSCCFSGHRELPSGAELMLLQRNTENAICDLYERGYTEFYAGGALGFDTFCELTVLKLRHRGYPIKLTVLVPFKAQSEKWSARDKKIYADILSLADKVEYISEEYSKSCFFKRNRELVDRSSALIYYMRKTPSGTAQTLNYAIKKDLELIKI